MKKPNYDDKQAKHPIPHAKDAIDSNRKVDVETPKGSNNKEEE